MIRPPRQALFAYNSDINCLPIAVLHYYSNTVFRKNNNTDELKRKRKLRILVFNRFRSIFVADII